MDAKSKLLAAAHAYVAEVGAAEAAARKFIDPQSEHYQTSLEVDSILLGRPVRYLAPFDSRVAKLASVLVFNRKRQVLIGRRSADMPDAPGTWGFPGGNGNKGETFEQIAVRQLREETGYEASVKDLNYAGQIEAEGNYGGEMNRHQVQAVYVIIIGEGEENLFSPKDETSELAWADPSDIGHPDIVSYGLGFLNIDGQILGTAVEFVDELFPLDESELPLMADEGADS